jgi:hypothetical protein
MPPMPPGTFCGWWRSEGVNPKRIDPERLLQACFGDAGESQLAFESCVAADIASGGAGIEPAARRLLPFFYRRWCASSSGSLIETAHRVYLATWQQNRERMASAASVLRQLESAGIECMLLKGAALTLGHYRDYGLRSMGDFDLLIHHADVERAAGLLLQDGWTAEEGCSAEAIRRQSRVRHAWQFTRGDTENCDLHWRPLARCYSPQVAGMFWEGAEAITLDGQAARIPCPTDQFFHVCVHAMHWEWTRNLYWIADALTVVRDAEPNWDRAAALAASSEMQTRFTEALLVLASHFRLAVPEQAFAAEAPAWERREYMLMQKPCPLGPLDSIAWHLYNFRRLRPFDSEWRGAPRWVALPQYLAAFLDAPTWGSLLARLWTEFRLRV